MYIEFVSSACGCDYKIQILNLKLALTCLSIPGTGENS